MAVTNIKTILQRAEIRAAAAAANMGEEEFYNQVITIGDSAGIRLFLLAAIALDMTDLQQVLINVYNNAHWGDITIGETVSRLSSFIIAQDTIDKQLIDLKQFAKAGKAKVYVNGTAKVEGTDFSMINGGMYPTKVRFVADVSSSLNNKYFTIQCSYNGRIFTVFYNVDGAGNPETVSAASTLNLVVGPYSLIEVKLASNDSALVVAQKTALAIRDQAHAFFQLAVPTALDSNGMAFLSIYTANGVYSGGIPQQFEMTYVPVNTAGFVISNSDVEKNSRVTFALQDKLMSRKLTVTLTAGSTRVLLNKFMVDPASVLANNLWVTGTGIPVGAKISAIAIPTASYPIVKTAFSREIAVTGDLSQVGHSNNVSNSASLPGGGSVRLVKASSYIDGNCIPRSASTIAANKAGSGTIVFNLHAFTLSAPATVSGTVEITLTQVDPTLQTQLKVGDSVIVEYDMDSVLRDCSTQVMKGVKFGGPIGTANDADKSWLAAPATSFIDLKYRVGGNLTSKNTLVLCFRASGPSGIDYPYLIDQYGIDARVIAVEMHNPTLVNYPGSGSADQLFSSPTGAGSLSAYSGSNGTNMGLQSHSNATRALCDFLDKLGRGPVYIASGRGSVHYIVDAVRFRPDLFKGHITGDQIYYPMPVGGIPGAGIDTNSFASQYFSSGTYDYTKFSILTFNNSGSFYDVVGAAKYWTAYTAAGALHYFWYKVTTGGANVQTDPAVAGGIGHQISIAFSDTSSSIASKTSAAIESSMFSIFIPFVNTDNTNILTVETATVVPSASPISDSSPGTSGVTIVSPSISDMYTNIWNGCTDSIRFAKEIWEGFEGVSLLGDYPIVNAHPNAQSLRAASFSRYASISFLVQTTNDLINGTLRSGTLAFGYGNNFCLSKPNTPAMDLATVMGNTVPHLLLNDAYYKSVPSQDNERNGNISTRLYSQAYQWGILNATANVGKAPYTKGASYRILGPWSHTYVGTSPAAVGNRPADIKTFIDINNA